MTTADDFTVAVPHGLEALREADTVVVAPTHTRAASAGEVDERVVDAPARAGWSPARCSARSPTSGRAATRAGFATAGSTRMHFRTVVRVTPAGYRPTVRGRAAD